MKLVQPGNVCGSPGAESLPLTITPALLVQLALGFADKAGLELTSQVHLERRARTNKGQRMQADRPHNSEFCHKKPKLPTKEDIIVMNWAFLFFFFPCFYCTKHFCLLPSLLPLSPSTLSRVAHAPNLLERSELGILFT